MAAGIEAAARNSKPPTIKTSNSKVMSGRALRTASECTSTTTSSKAKSLNPIKSTSKNGNFSRGSSSIKKTNNNRSTLVSYTRPSSRLHDGSSMDDCRRVCAKLQSHLERHATSDVIADVNASHLAEGAELRRSSGSGSHTVLSEAESSVGTSEGILSLLASAANSDGEPEHCVLRANSTTKYFFSADPMATAATGTVEATQDVLADEEDTGTATNADDNNFCPPTTTGAVNEAAVRNSSHLRLKKRKLRDKFEKRRKRVQHAFEEHERLKHTSTQLHKENYKRSANVAQQRERISKLGDEITFLYEMLK
eukprot:Lankesteria_metandrocarpae@DN5508_c0_g1_i1.p1